MNRRLWHLPALALLLAAGLIFHPLAMEVAASSSLPEGWTDDPELLTLPSSPTYPAVSTSRNIRLRLADRDTDKALLLLGFASDDADAIVAMAGREDYVHAVAHRITYERNVADSLFWLTSAKSQGYHVSAAMSHTVDRHLAQQSSLAAAGDLMPWEYQGQVLATQIRVAEMLLHALLEIEDESLAAHYVASLASTHPVVASAIPALPHTPPPENPPNTDNPTNGEPPAVPSEPIDSGSQPAEPRIDSLRISDSSVTPHTKVLIDIILAQGNLDDLEYSWWCSRGDLSVEGPTAAWTAPETPGTYEIGVTVVDSRSKVDIASVEIEVIDAPQDEPPVAEPPVDEPAVPEQQAPADRPNIIALSASADHKYLSEGLSGYAILVSEQAVLRCEVPDSAGCSFRWSTTGGTITGSGDRVVFTAPTTRGNVTVTVTVTNAVGEQDSRSLTFHVTTCRPCFT